MNTQKTGDELLYYKNDSLKPRATPADFSDSTNVILFHGFTANSDYLLSLAKDLSQYDINVFLYNYNSYKGIDRAGTSFIYIMDGLNTISKGSILKKKIVIVAHSMGGLVARSLCQNDNGEKYISGILTIGTPHDGTLTDIKYLHACVKYYESLAGSGAPKGYRKDCLSMRQLMKQDKKQFLISLDKTKAKLKGLKLKSISGGKKFLEVSKYYPINKIVNKVLQAHLGANNDGLVMESSSDWSNNIHISCKGCVTHINKYPEYSLLNHTYLIKNQSVSLKVAAFAK